MDKLVVCQVCRRHVKEHDARCPFCRNAMPAASRAGIALVGAVAVGVSLAACGNAVTMYGPAPYDAAPPNDAGADADAEGGLLGAYGPPPPVDAGQD